MPQNRLTPLKENWMKLYQPVTEHMQLDMRMNLKTKKVCMLSIQICCSRILCAGLSSVQAMQ